MTNADAAGATAEKGSPRQSLSLLDAIAIIVGIVIGSMIFKAPSWVAGFSPSVTYFITFWVLGGVISLIGALCYAELAATYPDAGGDYHFLSRAYGPSVGFLFAWARLAIIQTGSIAIQAFVIGDYASKLLPIGAASSAIYAAVVVLLLTALNIAGIRQGKWAQIVLTACEVLGVILLILAGFTLASRGGAAAAVDPAAGGATFSIGGAGMAMVFVLLTYGGWNEAAYLSAEVRGRRGIAAALLLSIGLVTAIYVLANVAMVAGLGLDGVANSSAVAADLAGGAFGSFGGVLISIIVVIAAASTTNATIITGARTNYALGRDFPLLARLGQWSDRGGTPTNALIVQGLISLVLVVLAGISISGFKAMVDYTTPVFWFFFLLATGSLLVLRRREPHVERPFRVPLYPLTPILFIVVCGYMFYSSVMYAGIWSLVGLAVLAAGVPLLLIAKPGRRREVQPGFEPVMAEG
ncbi:MAG: amino acid permease [Planctomycetota bacterium]|nr:amino acid permease [Planctomycetota bacterium]